MKLDSNNRLLSASLMYSRFVLDCCQQAVFSGRSVGGYKLVNFFSDPYYFPTLRINAHVVQWKREVIEFEKQRMMVTAMPVIRLFLNTVKKQPTHQYYMTINFRTLPLTLNHFVH